VPWMWLVAGPNGVRKDDHHTERLHYAPGRIPEIDIALGA
jgi:hypothetical protein